MHPVSNNMLRHKLLHWVCAAGMLLLVMLKLGFAGDSCSWKGSGLIRNPHSRAVEQIHLRCTQGSLLWMYPTRALRVILEPNLANGKYTTACIKPSSSFHGADIYIEEGGKMHLLVNEAHGTQHLRCFGMDTTHRVTIFLMAHLAMSPNEPISIRYAHIEVGDIGLIRSWALGLNDRIRKKATRLRSDGIFYPTQSSLYRSGTPIGWPHTDQ
ncbi:meteorin-like protein [Xenopus laevis]|uniref:Meteorin-like protein n=1 Tax=Xenopus laevis TaxID=8355 RepID=A0A8J1LXJ3_XENLA|nr:meteorin-like protein [Xenopus laevis]